MCRWRVKDNKHSIGHPLALSIGFLRLQFCLTSNHKGLEQASARKTVNLLVTLELIIEICLPIRDDASDILSTDSLELHIDITRRFMFGNLILSPVKASCGLESSRFYKHFESPKLMMWNSLLERALDPLHSSIDSSEMLNMFIKVRASRVFGLVEF